MHKHCGGGVGCPGHIISSETHQLSPEEGREEGEETLSRENGASSSPVTSTGIEEVAQSAGSHSSPRGFCEAQTRATLSRAKAEAVTALKLASPRLSEHSGERLLFQPIAQGAHHQVPAAARDTGSQVWMESCR